MQKRTPTTVKDITMRATNVSTDHTYHDRPRMRRRRAIWSMMGRLPMNDRNYHFSRPSNLRWRSPLVCFIRKNMRSRSCLIAPTFPRQPDAARYWDTLMRRDELRASGRWEGHRPGGLRSCLCRRDFGLSQHPCWNMNISTDSFGSLEFQAIKTRIWDVVAMR
jgi:hypothetical protein